MCCCSLRTFSINIRQRRRRQLHLCACPKQLNAPQNICTINIFQPFIKSLWFNLPRNRTDDSMCWYAAYPRRYISFFPYTRIVFLYEHFWSVFLCDAHIYMLMRCATHSTGMGAVRQQPITNYANEYCTHMKFTFLVLDVCSVVMAAKRVVLRRRKCWQRQFCWRDRTNSKGLITIRSAFFSGNWRRSLICKMPAHHNSLHWRYRHMSGLLTNTWNMRSKKCFGQTYILIPRSDE